MQAIKENSHNIHHLLNMSKINIPSDEIRLLLALFQLGGQDVSKSQWLNLFKRKSEKVKDMQPLVTSLEQGDYIKINTNKSIQQVSLLLKGQSKLRDSLINNQLSFSSNVVSTKFVKALLQWIQSENMRVNISADSLNLDSYPEFKQQIMQIYEKLNSEYKFGDLVPIYHIRRQVGEAVERHKFDEWLLEMQADDILQLLEGSVEDSASDKLADSIRTPLSGLRCYARKLQ
jgi:primosomal protein N'